MAYPSNQLIANYTVLALVFSLLVLTNCKPKFENQSKENAQNIILEMSPAEKLLTKTIEAHGGIGYDTAHFQFTFRDSKYSFKNSKEGFIYTVNKMVDDQSVFDKIENNIFTREVDGEIVDLSDKDRDKFSSALNSVIYFATLPYKLKDPAVNLSLGENVTIKEQNYKVLEVTFQEEGGGSDFDDEFAYWINEETNRIDYLAYNYKVNKGGVRFRSAFNTRVVEGVLFQDYTNYKAEVGTPLIELPTLFEEDKLEQLSIIATEDVRVL